MHWKCSLLDFKLETNFTQIDFKHEDFNNYLKDRQDSLHSPCDRRSADSLRLVCDPQEEEEQNDPLGTNQILSIQHIPMSSKPPL